MCIEVFGNVYVACMPMDGHNDLIKSKYNLIAAVKLWNSLTYDGRAWWSIFHQSSIKSFRLNALCHSECGKKNRSTTTAASALAVATAALEAAAAAGPISWNMHDILRNKND